MIGEGSVVGAGAVVLSNFKVPHCSLVLGMPARIKAEVLYKHYQEILNSAEQYAEYAMNYLKNMNI